MIVIGAAEGGVPAVVSLVQGLPAALPAALLVVIHSNANHSQLPRLLSGHGLQASYARSGDAIAPGRIYVASMDEHLVVDGRTVRLSRGPSEHHHRPAIDPLFRSAALAYGESVIGVLLTGALDDGIAGLQAISRMGGVVVVQNPGEAFEPSMPQAALDFCEVDHCLSLPLISLLLAELSQRPAEALPAERRPDDATVSTLRSEVLISLSEGSPVEHLQTIAKPSSFTCPDCHGGLWEVLDSRPVIYRCHTGHAFTERSLESAMASVSREAMWNAYRAVQERELLLQRMAEMHRSNSEFAIADRLDAAAEELREQVDSMRSLIQKGPGQELDTAVGRRSDDP